MPREHSRSQRVAEEIRRILSELIRREIEDRNTGFVTLTEIDLSRDMSHAKVFFSVIDPQEQAEAATDRLEQAKGFLRGELGRKLRIRTIPELQFFYDDSLERGARVTRLIDETMSDEND